MSRGTMIIDLCLLTSYFGEDGYRRISLTVRERTRRINSRF